MDTCVRCGAELGVGRFCLNCGHRIGDPAPPPVRPAARPPAPRTAPSGPAPSGPAPSGPAPSVPAPGGASTVPAVTGPGPAEAPPRGVPVQAADPTPVPPTREPATAWDPEADLLPYHDADDLGPDEPIAGRGWIAWVVGAVVLVVLVVVLLRVFATDPLPQPDSGADTATGGSTGRGSGTGTTEEAADETTGNEAPQGVGARLVLSDGATFAVPGTAPPTTDLDGDLVAYDADQMGDGNPSTTWRTAGDASGQTVTITLPEPGVVDRVGLVNGYAKQVEGVDWYPNNRRILSVTWGFDDGTTVEQSLAERPGLQRVGVPPVTTTSITLTIGAVTPPGGGSLGRDYTAISEVVVLGRRAG